MNRGECNLNIKIVGRPGVVAQMPFTVVGVRPGSADGLWRIKTARRHIIEGDSHKTSIDAELPN